MGAWVPGVDVSHYQHPSEVFARGLASDGVRYVWIKVSQGGSSKDAQRDAHHANFGKAGIARGAYHFYDFGASPVDNAKNMAAAMAGKSWEMPPALDAEKGGGGPPPRTAAELLSFLAEIERMTGKRPMVYTGGWWYGTVDPDPRFTAYRLWVAQYPNAYKDGHLPPYGKAPKVPAPWTSASVWQYSDSNGRLDRNVMTEPTFAAILGQKATTPKPHAWEPPKFPGRTLRLGSRGPDVAQLKVLLRAAGYGNLTGSVFGPGTAVATRHLARDYYRANKIVLPRPVSSAVGPHLWAFLCDVVKVRKAQGKA